MVIPKYLNFYSIIFIKICRYNPNTKKEYAVLGMVKSKFLEVKIQNLIK